MTLEDLSFYVAMAGTVAFASSAVLSVADRKVDLFAAIVLGTITAVGGGTVRDIILDVPVFWANDVTYIWVSVAASVATFVAYRFFEKQFIRSLFLYVDAFAVAMFAVQASAKVWDLGFGLPVAPVILGVITAIGGGLIRDVLAQRQTLLMSRELYAVPVLIGCILYTLMLAYMPQHRLVGSVLCLVLIFGIRAAAIHWNLQVPEWAMMGAKRR
ncbi:MAG: trimeric intracellular cation channel family protein [Methyloceanibacter sp.]